MLTDSVSQFETGGINDIPKSFQKLINEIQNVKKHKKQSKNPPLASLNVRTVQKNPKKLTTAKKKRKPKQQDPLQDEIDWEKDDESNVAKNSVQILNQTNITEFFYTVKTNLSNRSNGYVNKNLQETKKQEVPNVDKEMILSDDDNLFYSNQNPTTDCNDGDFPPSQFQNPDYLNFLSSRNDDFKTNSVRDNFENTRSSVLRGEPQTKENSSWKTFSEINANTDCDFDIERRKTIAPSVFYNHSKSNTKPSIKPNIIINNSVPSMTRNQDIGLIRNERKEKNAAYNWLNMLKCDQEKMANLLDEVQSMNEVISKSIQDISKFFGNRNN